MRNLYAALNLEADEAVIACVESNAAAAVTPVVPVSVPVPVAVPAPVPATTSKAEAVRRIKNIEPQKDPEPQADQKLDGEAKAKQIVYDHADAVERHLDAMDEIDRQHAMDEQLRWGAFIREFCPSWQQVIIALIAVLYLVVLWKVEKHCR
jgi:hypothetical protein